MATAKVIEIKPVAIQTIQIKIEGDTPLICHKFSNAARKAILDKQMGIRTQRAPKDPEKNFRACIYQAKEGWYGFPADGIKKACVDVCRFVPSMAMTQARGAFFVIPVGVDAESAQSLVMLQGDPEMHEVMVKLRDVADVRYRAVFFPWSMSFTVRYNPNVIIAEAIINLVQLAGFHQGLGDWRPEKNGTHGTFHVCEQD